MSTKFERKILKHETMSLESSQIQFEFLGAYCLSGRGPSPLNSCFSLPQNSKKMKNQSDCIV